MYCKSAHGQSTLNKRWKWMESNLTSILNTLILSDLELVSYMDYYKYQLSK